MMRNNGNTLKSLDKEVDAIHLLDASYRIPTKSEIKEYYGKFWKLRYALHFRKKHNGFFKAYNVTKNDKDFQK